MKCEYCNIEIEPGAGKEIGGHFFCSNLHRYSWEKEHGQLLNAKPANGLKRGADDSSSVSAILHSDDEIYYNRHAALGDIFSTGIKMIGQTIFANIAVALSFFIPASLVLYFGLGYGVTKIKEYAVAKLSSVSAGLPDTQSNAGIYTGLAVIVLSVIVFLMAYLASEIGSTVNGCRTAEGKKASIKEAFKEIFSITYLRCLGQSIIIILFSMLCVLIVSARFLFDSYSDQDVVTALEVFALIAWFIFVIYILIRWYFAFVALIHSKVGVFQSFSVSSFLVKNRWWRTLCILIVVLFVTRFAYTVIITPIGFLMNMNSSEMLLSLNNPNAIVNNPEQWGEAMKSIIMYSGLMFIIYSLWDSLIANLFNIAIYFEYKKRE
jgi:hypothetical protein